MEPELIADYECVVGEGPLWHPTEKRVYWVDIPSGRLFRYDPAAGTHEHCYTADGAIGGFTIQADGALLLFMARGAVAIWREGVLETVIDEMPAERESRFNDVIADPAGRVFCGTMPSGGNLGRLYRLDTDGTLTPVVEEVGCSNGMGFTPDRKAMYFTDSTPRTISLFDYNQSTGELSNRRIFVDSTDEPGVPDGMTVDAEGCVWSARWGGHCVIRYAPDGTEDRRIEFPANQVSCAIFGGDDYADMYVTTAGGKDKAKNGPGAGALYRVRPGVAGVPEFPSRIGL
jgi:sugar lactone lactonase YvrE